MHMKRILTIVMLFLGTFAFAQKHSVTGKVTDQTGYPVIGLSVIEQGTQNGAITDADGNYSITTASPSSVLVFDALGYTTVTEQVGGRSVTVEFRIGVCRKIHLPYGGAFYQGAAGTCDGRPVRDERQLKRSRFELFDVVRKSRMERGFA